MLGNMVAVTGAVVIRFAWPLRHTTVTTLPEKTCNPHFSHLCWQVPSVTVSIWPLGHCTCQVPYRQALASDGNTTMMPTAPIVPTSFLMNSLLVFFIYPPFLFYVYGVRDIWQALEEKDQDDLWRLHFKEEQTLSRHSR